jgi:hypothetical protein
LTDGANAQGLLQSPSVDSRPDAGQALVEAALTLPLVLFVMLGTVQLFLMMQARMMAEYAVFKAARAGAMDHGRCLRMKHVMIGALLPTFTRTVSLSGSDHARVLGEAFGARLNGKYSPALDSGHDGDIIWLYRERPGPADLARLSDDNFDVLLNDAQTAAGAEPVRLELRAIFWFPLRVPFAGPVMSRMFLAMFGLRPATGVNPLIVTQQARWSAELKHLDDDVGAELASRVARGQYEFPVQATHALRMLTPAYASDFVTARCP